MWLRVACLLLCGGPGAAFGSESSPLVALDVDLSHAQNKVNERFLSVAVDASLVSEEKYMRLLSAHKLRTLARALSPGFLRFGGTTQDFMVFTPRERAQGLAFGQDVFTQEGSGCVKQTLSPALEEKLKQEWAVQKGILLQEEMEGLHRKVKFSETAVDLLYSFANCSGFELIFGLNALLRTENNAWNSRNAQMLLSYCKSKEYKMSWELGNEPNSYMKKAGIRVDGYQLGQDFIHLRKILQKTGFYNNTGLYGPDVGQPHEHRRDLLEGFLESGATAINACTWHHYYVNGRETSLKDFLDPDVLDTLAVKTNEIMQEVKLVSPEKTVWLGETGSAYGGGAAGISDSFVAGFMWLDKLGLSAKLGVNVVIRQVLIGGGSYDLVDANLDPLPDYWLSVLYKRLVGPVVLDVTAFPMLEDHKRRVRVYLHCTNKRSAEHKSGAVTLFALNLSKTTAEISLPAKLGNSSTEAYVLESGQPGAQGLCSRSVLLNGKLLKMVDDHTLPHLQGIHLPPGHHLPLPGFSFAFYVLKDAEAQVCS